MSKNIEIFRRLPRLRHVGHRLGGIMAAAFFVILSLLIVATSPRAEPEQQVEKRWPVSFRAVVPQALSPSVQVYGKLEAEQVASLRSALVGTVSHIHFREGDWVEQGDVIVSLVDDEMQLNVIAAQAELQRANAQLASVETNYALAKELSIHHQAQAALSDARLERFISLHQQRMIADAQLDDVREEVNERAMTLARHQANVKDFPNQLLLAQAAVTAAQTLLDRAKLDLSYTRLRAPFAGRVLSITTAVGDRVLTGASLSSIADYDGLRVRAAVLPAVAQQLRQQLAIGQPVTGNSRLSGRELVFELTGLAGDIRPGQGGVDAFFGVEAQADLSLGLVLPLTLSLPAEQNVFTVPQHALYDNSRVYRISGSRLEALEVQRLGEYLDQHGNYELLVRSSAINAGDHIMVSQLTTAVSGLLVDPIDSGSGSALADANASQLLTSQWSSH